MYCSSRGLGVVSISLIDDEGMKSLQLSVRTRYYRQQPTRRRSIRVCRSSVWGGRKNGAILGEPVSQLWHLVRQGQTKRARKCMLGVETMVSFCAYYLPALVKKS